MDKELNYADIVKAIIQSFVEYYYKDSEIQPQLIFDDERQHYLLLELGWTETGRVYAPIMHLDIIDGRIWIQNNQTEADLDMKLIEAGIKEEDIVLGFYPYVEKYTSGSNHS